MKPKAALRHFLALAGSLLLAISSADAQSTSNTWNTDAAGNWTDVLNWTGDAAYAAGTDNTATLGDFITVNRTITLDAPITIGNITALDGNRNYTISGANTLTLDRTTGTPMIHVANGNASTQTLIISSVIAGNDGLNKVGPGTLALSGANNYSGTTTITQGTLNLGNGGSTGSLASTSLALGGGTLSYTRTGTNTHNFTSTAINAGNSSVNSTVGTNTLGLGTITQSAGGTLNVGTTGTITTSNTNVNNILGPWAFYNTGASTTYAKVSGSNISGLGYTGGTDGTAAASAAALTTDATGNFSFTGGGGALGGTSFNTLRYTGATGAMTGAFTVNGIMNAGSGTLTFSDAVTIGSTNELVVNAASNNITFSSAIGNNGSNASSFTKVGTGTVSLAGNNTYTGLTVVGAGILNVNHNNALGSSTGENSHTILSAVTGTGSPRINLNSSITTAENITITGETENGSYFSPLTASGSGGTLGTYSGTITLAGSGAIRIGPANWTGTITQSGTSHKLIFVGGSNTVSNPMTINGADVTIGEGTTTFNAVNGTGIGSTDIYAFSGTTTLRLGVTNAIRTDRDLTFNNTATVRLDLNGKNQTIRGLITTTGSNTRTVNNDASGTTSTLTVGNGGGNYSFGGTIINATTGTGIVAFTKIGTGTQTLTGANTYTGATTITAGTLDLGGATATGSLTSTVLNLGGGTLSYTRTGTNSQSFTTTNLTTGASTVGSTNASNTLNLGNIVRSAGATLSIGSTGTITATNTNTNGIIGGWALIDGSAWAVQGATPGTDDITALASYTTTTSAGTNGTNYLNANMDVDNSAGTIAAAINTNSLRFNTAAANTVTLNGSGTNIIQSGGILVTSNVGNNPSTITGGTLVGSASGDLVIHQHNTSNRLAIESIIANNGGATGLTKSGAGVLTLSGTNTYSGATTVDAGTLYVTGSLGSSQVIVKADGTIGSSGGAGSRSLGNGLAIEAGGNLDLTGATIGSNSTDILSLTGGTLTLGNLTFQDLVGWDWANAAPGTYELIDGTFSIDWGSTAYLDPATAYDFGNGNKGYFTAGSLNAVIVAIPEPGAALLGGLGILLMFRRRR